MREDWSVWTEPRAWASGIRVTKANARSLALRLAKRRDFGDEAPALVALSVAARITAKLWQYR